MIAALPSTALADCFILYFPSFISIGFAGFSLNKYDAFCNSIFQLGEKKGEIINKKSKRVYIITPLYCLLFIYGFFIILLIRHFLILNYMILAFSIVLVFIFERKIYMCNKRQGIYEKGIVYGKGSFIYGEIPEIRKIERGLEILNQSGMTEDFLLDGRAEDYLDNTLFQNKKKIINKEWESKMTNKHKKFKDSSGRVH